MAFLAGILLGFLVGWFLGYRTAHITVASECERLGGFFHNKKTYKCTEIIDHIDVSDLM